ncbi:hypothetical protein E4U19_005311 [Claviceps sp. Clav32 group G5]|nr:hypothetical protein E4U19_005311 [Claviceps sp. Clav32 group G5]KAG6048758.1 hypothetical protein E4U39_007020 [Claviceps sp. Clav50 group G5]
MEPFNNSNNEQFQINILHSIVPFENILQDTSASADDGKVCIAGFEKLIFRIFECAAVKEVNAVNLNHVHGTTGIKRCTLGQYMPVPTHCDMNTNCLCFSSDNFM